jgi:hypothetical protein
MPNSEYEFHTGELDGIEQTAVCFLPGSGLFLEFQNPGNHDEWAKFQCPRTGKVVTYNGTLDKAKKVALGGHVWGSVPADRWQQFRTEYINADVEPSHSEGSATSDSRSESDDDESHEYAREKIQELTEDPPAETGVA